MTDTPVNYFPPELRELVEADEYLLRVQTSMARKAREWGRRGYNDAAYVAQSTRARIVEIRKAYAVEMERMGRDIPIVASGVGVKYVGYQYLLRVLIRIDIRKANSPASLWRFGGYGLSRGGTADVHLTREHPGTVTYSTRLRKALGQIMYNLMHRRSAYRQEYDRYFKRQIEKGIPVTRAASRAKRYMIKMWLKHLWRVWRRQEGLPYDNHHEDDRSQFAADYGWL